jgi:hypothetical protein
VFDPRDELAPGPDVISSGGDASGTSRWPALARLTRRLSGSRRARIAATAVLACAAAAGVVIALLNPTQPTRSAHPVPALVITNALATGAGGVFAHGAVNGAGWRLAVQDIADPGYQCVPGVTFDGNDADPVFAALRAPLASPIGSPAFITPGSGAPGAGFAFVQVPADVSQLSPGPGIKLAPVAVTVCGEKFRLAGFAYPLASPLRIHASFTDRPAVSYPVPGTLSQPLPSLADPQVDGVWQATDTTHGQVAAATLAAGKAFGLPWSIRLMFGTAGDCFSLKTSYIDDSAAPKPDQIQTCGPISTPRGPDTIMALPLSFPADSGPGTGYAISIGAGPAQLTAELSDGTSRSVTPVVVDGRKYAAFFIPGPAHLTELEWDTVGYRDVPLYGYAQFQPLASARCVPPWRSPSPRAHPAASRGLGR